MAQLNPIINPTQDDVIAKQVAAIRRALNLATGIEGVASQEQALVREMLPTDDLGSGSGNNWTETNQEWLQSGLTADQENDVYDITSTDEAQNKVYVFYGVTNVASDLRTTEILFKDSTGATFADFNIQVLQIPEISDIVLFDEPIEYGPTANGTITQWANAAGNDAMVYLAKVAEPLGNTLSARAESPSQ